MQEIEVFGVEKGIEIFKDRLELIQETISYEQSEIADSTRARYDDLWKMFQVWCDSYSINPLPASYEILSLFIADISKTHSISTIELAVCAIKKVHTKKNTEITGDRLYFNRVRRGILRRYGDRPIKKAKALSLMEFAIKASLIEDTPIGVRNKAILAIGFFGALRRSEIINLNWENVEFYESEGRKGVKLTLIQTKESLTPVTIYLSEATCKHICPVHTLVDLLATKGTEASVFKSIRKGGNVTEKRMSSHNVSIILKKYFGEDYSGHSMRRGVITELANKNTPIHIIKKISRHKDLVTLSGYMEVADGYKNTSSKILNA